MELRAPPTRDGPSLLDLLPVGVILADGDASAVYANRTWTALTGQNPHWRGHGWLDVLDGRHRDAERENILARIRAGKSYGADWRVSPPGRTSRVLRVFAVPSIDDGEARMVVSVTDVTADRDRAARLLHQATHDSLTGLCNRAQFMQFLAHALRRLQRRPGGSVAVFFVDVDGLKFTNDTFGHDAGDRLLQEVAAQLSAAVRPADIVARYGGDEFTVLCDDLPGQAEVTAIADRIRGEAEHSTNGNQRAGLSVGFVIADDADADPTAIVRLADRAMYEGRRKPRTPFRPRRLQPVPHEPEGHREANTGDDDGVALLARAAHELRTPLTAVLGFATTLRERRHHMTAEQIENALTALERHAQRLAVTLEELLDLGRARHDIAGASAADAGIHLVDLREVIADAVQLAPPPSGVDVQLPTSTDRLPSVSGDATTLSRLLVNLLTNSYRSEARCVRVTVDSDPDTKRVRLAVHDDGRGVPPDIRSTMFQPFVTQRPLAGPVSGAGLGLAIARDIAQSLGGSLDHEDVEPHGARFTLTLPAAGTPQGNGARVRSATPTA